jgi:tellurite resistance protein TehA-like permease
VYEVSVDFENLRTANAFGGRLMPVVPPMVSAATGAALVPHLPVGPVQQAMLVLCWSFLGITLARSAVMVGLIIRRLVRVGLGPAAGLPRCSSCSARWVSPSRRHTTWGSTAA